MKSLRSLRNIAGIVAIATLISKLFGVLRSTSIAAVFGVGPVANAYYYAYIIPGFLMVLVGGINGPIHTALVSILAKQQSLNTENTDKLVATINTLITMILLPLSIIIFIFAPFWINLLAPGLNEPVREAAIHQLQIMAPIALLSGLIGVGMGSLNSADFYWLPSVSPMLSSLCVIISLGFFAWYSQGDINSPDNILLGGIILALGTLAGAVFQWLAQLLLQIKKGIISIRPDFNFASSEVREFMGLMFPSVLSAGIYNINVYIDLWFASYIPYGAASLSYAQLLSYTPVGIISNVLLVPLLPRFSQLAANEKWTQLRQQIRQSIIFAALIILPLAALMAFMAVPIVRIIYQRQAFDEKAVKLVASVLVAYSLEMFPSVCLQLLMRVYYALGDAKTPFRISAFNILFNIGLDYFLVTKFGIPGLVLATMVINIIALGRLLSGLNHRIGGLSWHNMSLSIIGIAAASIVAGFVSWQISLSISGFWEINGMFLSLTQLGISATVGLGVFILLAILLAKYLKLKEVDYFAQLLYQRFR
ncbi:MAG: murein biosynthesis integral membrane protein MurJ [Cyanobacteria bacterium P01_A01_bin.45]